MSAEIWAVRDIFGEVLQYFTYRVQAETHAEASNRLTVTRETLLTPEQAAVIAAAEAYVAAEDAYDYADDESDPRSRNALLALHTAVTTLRAQEGEG